MGYAMNYYGAFQVIAMFILSFGLNQILDALSGGTAIKTNLVVALMCAGIVALF